MVAGARHAAKLAGQKYYFTGKPCRRGHIDQRFVSSFRCVTCGREKANEQYAALDAERRKQRCRDRAAYQREYRQQHSDHLKAYGAVKRKEFHEQHPDYFKEHYAKNAERKKRQAGEWYHANAERAGKRQKAYNAKRRAEHPDHVLAVKQRHAAKRRAIVHRVFVEVVDRRTVFTRDKGVCGICGKRVDVKSKWEVDHIIPISKGGAHAYANVQLAHQVCNRSKNARLPKGQPTLFQVAVHG